MSNIDDILEVADRKWHEKDQDTALEVLNQGLVLFPDAIRLLEQRGRYLYNVEEFPKALLDMSKIIELSNDYELIAWARNIRFTSSLHTSNTIQALEDIDWLIEHAPDYVFESRYVTRGELLEKLGDFEAAIAALSLFPIEEIHTEKMRCFYRGRIFARLSQYEKAIADFTWILENIPENQWYGVVLIALNLRALVYLNLGQHELYERDLALWKKHYPKEKPYESLEEYFSYYPIQKR